MYAKMVCKTAQKGLTSKIVYLLKKKKKKKKKKKNDPYLKHIEIFKEYFMNQFYQNKT